MRVPLRARTCRRNWPASTDGKKSWPSCGTSSSEPRQKARKSEANTPRWCNRPPSKSRYPSRNRSKPPSKLVWMAVKGSMRLESRIILFLFLSASDSEDEEEEEKEDEDDPLAWA